MNKCLICKEVIPSTMIINGSRKILNHRRYCLKCSPYGAHNNIQLHLRKPKKDRECPVCGKRGINVKYCSNNCQRFYEWEIRKKKIILNGFENSPRCAKKFIVEKTGHICSICKETKWMGQQIPLVLDHINGNYQDSRIENMRLVCGNCDMQLPTYKNKNYGNGRAFRRKRYAEGKSY